MSAVDKDQFAYLIQFLIRLKDSGLLDDHLFSSLQALSDSQAGEDLKQKVALDVGQLLDYVRKNSSLAQAEKILIEPSSGNQKPVRIFMDGCFDLMHSGHFNAIRQAKQLGDVLVVGVISSKEIEINKGPPVMSIWERAELVRACKWVDEVVENVPYNPTIELIDKLNCPYVAHGDDMAISADGMDSYYWIKKAGRMKTFKRTEGVSTTDIVGRLLLMTRQADLEGHRIRKLSQEGALTSNNFATKMENHINEEDTREETRGEAEYKSNIPKMKLLQTTRRIRQFSSGKEPKPTDKVVYVDGSFDILHIGHIRTLQKARELGDFLIVGIHDDDTISHHKGEVYPVLNLQERVLNVLSVKYVDEVIIGAPWRLTSNMIKNLNVQVVVEGDVYHKVTIREETEDPYEEAKKLGIYHRLKLDCTITTESIIERIIKNRIRYLQIQKVKEQKLANYYKTEDFSVKEQ